jgi:hypothetical protein
MQASKVASRPHALGFELIRRLEIIADFCLIPKTRSIRCGTLSILSWGEPPGAPWFCYGKNRIRMQEENERFTPAPERFPPSQHGLKRRTILEETTVLQMRLSRNSSVPD